MDMSRARSSSATSSCARPRPPTSPKPSRPSLGRARRGRADPARTDRRRARRGGRRQLRRRRAKALDLFADEAFERRCATPRCARSPPRSATTSTPLDADGKFLVALDPLDGSSNIDVNITIGTIFSVLDAPATEIVSAADFLAARPPPARRRASSLYGPQTSFLFTTGAGAHVATLDPASDRFFLTNQHLAIPEGAANSRSTCRTRATGRRR